MTVEFQIPLQSIQSAWKRLWPQALAVWSRFTKLSEPRWCFTANDEKEALLSQSFAMIRLTDQAVVISLRLVQKLKLERFGLEVMSHEIGHHVYCPGDLSDQARMIARMRRALPGKEYLAPMIANLYTDLMINDRLVRQHKLDIAGVYRTINDSSADAMWTFYMRICEILWLAPKGSLAKGAIDDKLEGDAQLGARLIRNYARDWLDGSGRFAALCMPYLLKDGGAAVQQIMSVWQDTMNTGENGFPDGLSTIDPGEMKGNLHPAFDDNDDAEGSGDLSGSADESQPGQSRGQARQPFEYGQIIKSLGLDLSEHDIAVRYYREQALPHLIPFPVILQPQSKEPLPEGFDVWDIGSPVDQIHWTESAIRSPYVIPGYTTVEQVYGTTEGSLPEKIPVDLDLYVDCSGSMPNPQHSVSYLTLAGAIISLSALRAGAKVQATLWSGKNQFDTTQGFVRDEQAILRILTGYLGDGTAFPIHKLRDTYFPRKPEDRKAHILIISDDGVTTMFEKDEQGNSGWDISAMALEKGRAGGTMVLNLYSDWQNDKHLKRAHKQGWDIFPIRDWAELVQFARAFSRKQYGNTI